MTTMNKFEKNIEKVFITKGNIGQSTLDSYIKYMNKLKQLMGYKGSSFLFLKDTGKVITVLEKNYTDNTQKTIFSIIVSILTIKKTFKTELRIYRGRMEQFKTIIDAHIAKNQLEPKEKEKFIEWNTLKTTMEREVNKTPKNIRDSNDLIITLITFKDIILPRLVLSTIKVKNFDTIIDNYYSNGKLVFNDFKNVNKMGSQTFKVSGATKTAIKNFLKLRHSRGIDNDFLLISNRNFKGIVQKKFSDYLKAYFKRYTGKDINNNLLRKIYTNHLLNTEKYRNSDESQRNEFHRRLLHDIKTASTIYRKINI